MLFTAFEYQRLSLPKLTKHSIEKKTTVKLAEQIRQYLTYRSVFFDKDRALRRVTYENSKSNLQPELSI